jgi:hypothetical protein
MEGCLTGLRPGPAGIPIKGRSRPDGLSADLSATPGIGWNGKQHHTMKGDSARLRFVSQPALDSRSTAGSAENYSSRKGEVLFRLTSISDGKIPSITEEFRRKRKDVPPAWAGIFLPQRSDK